MGDDTGDRALEQSAEQTAQKAIDLDPHRAIGYSARGALRSSFAMTGLVPKPTSSRRWRSIRPTIEYWPVMRGMLLNVGRLEQAEAMARKGDRTGSSRRHQLDRSWRHTRGHPGIILRPMRRSIARGRSVPRAAVGKVALRSCNSSTGRPRRRGRLTRAYPSPLYSDTGVALAEHSLGDAKASQQALDKLIAAIGRHRRVSDR